MTNLCPTGTTSKREGKSSTFLAVEFMTAASLYQHFGIKSAWKGSQNLPRCAQKLHILFLKLKDGKKFVPSFRNRKAIKVKYNFQHYVQKSSRCLHGYIDGVIKWVKQYTKKQLLCRYQVLKPLTGKLIHAKSDWCVVKISLICSQILVMRFDSSDIYVATPINGQRVHWPYCQTGQIYRGCIKPTG